ncbi:hypothetical protein [Phyllobacterium sp. P5_D12]|jgi:acetylornithine deacetylase
MSLGFDGKVKRKIEEHLFNVCRADPQLRKHPARIEWLLGGLARKFQLSIPLIRFSGKRSEKPACHRFCLVFGTHGDIGWPMGFGKPPTVNFGPGDPARAHQPNERVSVRDLVDHTKAIALAIKQWCR